MTRKIATLMLQSYDGVLDKQDVIEMCKNVYDGHDRVPRSLDGYENDTRCRPLVLRDETKTIAFANVKLFQTDDETQDTIYIEAIRVSENYQNNGIGSHFLQAIMQEIQTWQRTATTIRFLSTTIPTNFAMIKIFRKTGWVERELVQIWPSFNVFHNTIKLIAEKPQPYIQALGIASLIPSAAKQAVNDWRQLSSAAEIAHYLQVLRNNNACGFRTMYYIIDTYADASSFTDEPHDEKEGREVWVLERNAMPPVLIFIHPQSLKTSFIIPPNMISACTVDLHGAECCVAFAANRKYLIDFRLVFDSRITHNLMQQSPLFRDIEASTYCIYEAQG